LVGRVRLIITREVRHLGIATLGMIGGDTDDVYLDIYLFYAYDDSTLFEQKHVGFRVMVMVVSAAYRPPWTSMISYVLNADSGR